jgi:hypothetical protein
MPSRKQFSGCEGEVRGASASTYVEKIVMSPFKNTSQGLDPVAVLIGMTSGIAVIVVGRLLVGVQPTDFIGAVMSAAISGSAMTRQRDRKRLRAVRAE